MSEGVRYLHQLELVPENVEYRDLRPGDLVTFQGNEVEVVGNKFDSLTQRGCVVFRAGRTVSTVPYSEWQHLSVRRHAIPVLLPVDDPDIGSVAERIRQKLSLHN
jgi:hypothetical protein